MPSTREQRVDAFEKLAEAWFGLKAANRQQAKAATYFLEGWEETREGTEAEDHGRAEDAEAAEGRDEAQPGRDGSPPAGEEGEEVA